jgi:hypothetical protein
MGRSSFRMELAPFSLGDDDGVVSPMPEISTAPFDARAPEPVEGALPLLEVTRDLTEKLRIGTARTKILTLSRAALTGIGVAAFLTGLLTALVFSPAARSPLPLPAAPPPPLVELLPAPPPDLPMVPAARPAPVRPPVHRAHPPAPSSAWTDPFAN